VGVCKSRMFSKKRSRRAMRYAYLHSAHRQHAKSTCRSQLFELSSRHRELHEAGIVSCLVGPLVHVNNDQGGHGSLKFGDGKKPQERSRSSCVAARFVYRARERGSTPNARLRQALPNFRTCKDVTARLGKVGPTRVLVPISFIRHVCSIFRT